MRPLYYRALSFIRWVVVRHSSLCTWRRSTSPWPAWPPLASATWPLRQTAKRYMSNMNMEELGMQGKVVFAGLLLESARKSSVWGREVGCLQGVTRRRCLSWLTNSALVYRVQMMRDGGIVGSQPMSTAVHITWHGAQINFGDLSPYYFDIWAHASESKKAL